MVMAYANREGGDVWMNRRGSKERESRKEKEKRMDGYQAGLGKGL